MSLKVRAISVRSRQADNDYEVEVTASDGTNSAMQTIAVTVTDVDEVLGIPSAEAGISLYPNPASGHFTLKGGTEQVSGVTLISTSGKAGLRHYPAAKDAVYDTSGLDARRFLCGH